MEGDGVTIRDATAGTLSKHVDEEDKNTVTIRDGIQGIPKMGIWSKPPSSTNPASKVGKHDF